MGISFGVGLGAGLIMILCLGAPIISAIYLAITKKPGY